MSQVVRRNRRQPESQTPPKSPKATSGVVGNTKSKTYQRCVIQTVITLCVIVLIFLLGVVIGWLVGANDPKCNMKIPVADHHQVVSWSGDRAVGSVVRHFCTRYPNSPLHRLFVCNKRLEWELLVNVPCQCSKAPKPLSWSSAVLKWNGKKSFYSSASYTCSDCLNSKIALEIQCTENREWNITEETSCDCPPSPPNSSLSKDIFWKEFPDSEPKTGNIYSQMCSWLPNSPIHRTAICEENSNWLVLRIQDSCQCDDEPPSALRGTFSWSSKEPSKHIGTVITRHCTQDPSSPARQAYQCEVDKKWRLLHPEEDVNCETKDVLTPPSTFAITQIHCRQLNGQLKSFPNWEERFLLASELRRLAKNCPVDLFFLGVVEDLDYQWTSGMTIFPAVELKKLWDVDYPVNVDNKCVVMTKDGKRLRNKNCKIDRSCTVCQGDDLELTVDKDLTTISNAHELCKNKQMDLLVIKNQMDVDQFFEHANLTGSNCSDYVIDLMSYDRVWRDPNSNIVGVTFWLPGQPLSYDPCVAVDSGSNYKYWKSVSCDSIACGVCSQFIAK